MVGPWGGRRYHGMAVTYAQVAVRASLHREITESARTLVILDEVHHAGDSLSWGDAIREAFESATRRLSLTGTPFRSDTSPIPFVTYPARREGNPHLPHRLQATAMAGPSPTAWFVP